jgi:hypothetical protein
MDRHHYERLSWNAFCQLIIVRADMRAFSDRYATQIFGLAMGAVKIERFTGYNEAKKALVLSLAGVTTIMLIGKLFLLSCIE